MNLGALFQARMQRVAHPWMNAEEHALRERAGHRYEDRRCHPAGAPKACLSGSTLEAALVAHGARKADPDARVAPAG